MSVDYKEPVMIPQPQPVGMQGQFPSFAELSPFPPAEGSCEKIKKSGKAPCEGTWPTLIPKVLQSLCRPGPPTRRIFSQLQAAD